MERQPSFIERMFSGCATRIIGRLLILVACGAIVALYDFVSNTTLFQPATPTPTATLSPTPRPTSTPRVDTLQTELYVKGTEEDWSDATLEATAYIELIGTNTLRPTSFVMREFTGRDEEIGIALITERFYGNISAPLQCSREYMGVTVRVFSRDQRLANALCEALS